MDGFWYKSIFKYLRVGPGDHYFPLTELVIIIQEYSSLVVRRPRPSKSSTLQESRENTTEIIFETFDEYILLGKR